MLTHWTRDNLEGLDAAVLAALCKDAVEDAFTSPLVAEQLNALRQEWASLVSRITPPLPDPREQEKVEAAVEQVRMRMAYLMAAI